MAEYGKQEAWQSPCGHNVKGVHSFCGGCGNSWDRAQRGLYAPRQRKVQQQPWRAQDWQSQYWDWREWGGGQRTPRSNSPRTPRDQGRERSNPHKPKQHKGKQKGKGKGKEKPPKDSNSKGKGIGSGKGSGKALDPEPPWRPPPPGGGAASSSSTTPTAPSAAEIALKALVNEIKSTEGLSSEALRIVKENSVKQTQSEAKAMHSAVTKLGAAKKQYQTVLASQHTFFHEWTKYLAASSERWKKYLEEFCAHDAQLKEDLKNGQTNIRLAREELKALQETESRERKEGEHAVDDISDEELDTPNQSTHMMEGMQGIMQNLDTMHRKAEETLQALEPVNKRAKIDAALGGGAEAGGGVSSKMAPSMMPFGAPG